MVRRLHEAGHRGHPRRGLQPHRRGQPSRPDAVVPRHRQCQLLHARRGPRATISTRPAAATRVNLRHPRVLQMVMDSLRYWVEDLPRRRLPLRPRHLARPRIRPLRPERRLLRRDPPGPGPVAGEADRRAVGHRAERLPARQFPARLGASGTTATATTCARFWKGDAGQLPDFAARRPRLGRPLRPPRPQALGERQLRHRP